MSEVIITGAEAAVPVLRAAVNILRELARELVPQQVVHQKQTDRIDMIANQVELLADYMERWGK